MRKNHNIIIAQYKKAQYNNSVLNILSETDRQNSSSTHTKRKVNANANICQSTPKSMEITFAYKTMQLARL